MKKKRILIVIVILIMLLSFAYIFSLDNNKPEIKNDTGKNTTKIQSNVSNNKLLKNNSINNTENNVNSNNNYYNPSNKTQDHNHEKKVNKSFDEAKLAKLDIEKNVLNKNEIAGKPVYKHPSFDAWLVPIYDKKTKEFVGSVYVHITPDGTAGGYLSGPESYSEYKRVISGKSPSQEEINKYNREHGYEDIIEESDSSDYHVLAKDNPDPYPDSVISDEFCSNLEEPIILNSNPISPIVESGTEFNSTV